MKNLFFPFFSTLLLISFTMFCRGGYIEIGNFTGLPLSISLHLLLFFLLTLFFLKQYGSKLKPIKIIVTILIGSSIFALPVMISGWEQSWGFAIDILARWLGIFVAYVYYRFRSDKWKKYIILFSYILLGIWFTGWGVDIWIHYVKILGFEI